VHVGFRYFASLYRLIGWLMRVADWSIWILVLDDLETNFQDQSLQENFKRALCPNHLSYNDLNLRCG